MQKEPPPFVWAVPDEKNILTWNYIIRGPPDSPYAGGEYHGVLLFPPEYPFKPPGIKMLTPSGRFQTDKRICFSMSDFHPGTWNPAWSVATILTGLLSFMLSDEMTTGGLSSSVNDKRVLAAKSHSWNISQKRFKDAFPDHCTLSLKNLPNMGEKELGKPDEAPAIPLSANVSANGNVTSDPRLTSPFTTPTSAQGPHPAPKLNGDPSPPRGPATGTNDSHGVLSTWAAGLRNVIWEKWRWGALIALAVVVSRLSS